jgi:hypothetical protein
MPFLWDHRMDFMIRGLDLESPFGSSCLMQYNTGVVAIAL